METKPISVLDKGYVALINHMGDDLEVVNDAKASYERMSESYGPREIRLMKFLLTSEPQHTSPLRQSVLKFEIRAPLMVARQWHTYTVASVHREEQYGWNEASRRYITDRIEFYVPTDWRKAPENSKQGSGGIANHIVTDMFNSLLIKHQKDGEKLYNDAISGGLAPEQARLFLPAYGLYINWHWTASLQSVLHFLYQRLEHDAQWEIRAYAEAVKWLVKDTFPDSLKYFLGVEDE